MGELIRDGGLGTLPVLVLGLAAIGTALALALRPRRTILVLAVGSALGTLLSGVLGTLQGLRSAHADGILDAELGHCLIPTALALGVLGLALPLATIGAYRLALAEKRA